MLRTRRVALVTGASRGIGESIAVELASMGLALALTARHPDELASVVARCLASGAPAAAAFTADLSNPDELGPLIEAVTARFGGLDVLVNNAGVWIEEPVASADLAAWDRCLDVNLRAVIHLTHHALPWLVDGIAPAVVNISSIAGQRSYAGGGIYTATKHGLMGFSGSLFHDVRERGVKVCAVCPGYVDTAMHAGRPNPLDRSAMIQPADVARTVRFVLEFPANACPTEITLMPQRHPTSGGRR